MLALNPLRSENVATLVYHEQMLSGIKVSSKTEVQPVHQEFFFGVLALSFVAT